MKIKTYTAIKGVITALRDVYEDMPVTMMLVFMEVARDEGVTVSQVMQRTGLSQASASRNCRALTDRATPTRDGFDLCEFRPCPDDFRSKLLYLNDKGKALVKRLEEAMS